jgi:DNA polymerase III subunit gamma/tau
MAYQVLALKYRPKTFDEVVGQRAVVQTLKNSLTHGRIAHAYLFSGARGVGKTTVARLLAKALNCEKGPTVDPCNACPACTEIATSSSLDVLEIDGASNNSVDDVRELRETVRYAPSRDRYRIFIIDEVHMLSNSAFNALLKTLEEPPPHVVFIFATTEYRKIPVTILSRCQHFEFKRIARAEIAAHLARIAAAEKVTVSAYALDLIARLADGSLRDSQSTLDQVIAYSGSTVKDEEVRAVLGVLDRDLLLEFVEKVAEKDAAGLLGLVDRALETGSEPTLFLNNLMEQVRDLLLLKTVPGAEEKIGFAADDLPALRALEGRFSQEDLLRIMDAIAREEARLKFSPQPRYLLEALAVRLCHLTHLVPLEELLARFSSEEEEEESDSAPSRPRRTSASEENTDSLAPPRPKKPSALEEIADSPAPRSPIQTPPSSASSSSPPTPSSPLSPAADDRALEASSPVGDSGGTIPTESLSPTGEQGVATPDLPASPAPGDEPPDNQKQTEAILEWIHRQRSALYGFLSHASFFSLEPDAFVISLPEDKTFFKSSIERKDYLALIRSAVEEVTGRKLPVRVELVGPKPAEADLPGAEAKDEERRKQVLEEAKRSPVVQSFLDLFPGEITDIEEV